MSTRFLELSRATRIREWTDLSPFNGRRCHLRGAHGVVVGDLLTGEASVQEPQADRQLVFPYFTLATRGGWRGVYSFSTYISSRLTHLTRVQEVGSNNLIRRYYSMLSAPLNITGSLVPLLSSTCKERGSTPCILDEPMLLRVVLLMIPTSLQTLTATLSWSTRRTRSRTCRTGLWFYL